MHAWVFPGNYGTSDSKLTSVSLRMHSCFSSLFLCWPKDCNPSPVYPGSHSRAAYLTLLVTLNRCVHVYILHKSVVNLGVALYGKITRWKDVLSKEQRAVNLFILSRKHLADVKHEADTVRIIISRREESLLLHKQKEDECDSSW